MRRSGSALAVGGLVWLMAGIPAGAPAQFETEPFAGFALEAWGAGVAMIYDDPNGPVPAHPQGEMYAAYALATLFDGPSGHGVASELWPGATAATAGPFIEDSFWDQFEEEWEKNSGSKPPFQRVSLTPKQWPVAAEVFEPGGPHTHDVPPSAHSHSNDDGVYSKASSVPLHLPGVFDVDAASTTSQTSLGKARRADGSEYDAVRSEVVTTAADITISTPAGPLTIDEVTTTATVSSDGVKAEIGGQTLVSGLTIGGQGFTIDEGGLHAGGQTQPNPLLGPVNEGMAQALADSGITITLASPIDTATKAEGSRSVGGLIVHMTAERFDAFVSELPDPLESELRTRMSTTHDFRLILGAANVRATALQALEFEFDEELALDGFDDDFGDADVLGETFDSGAFDSGDFAAGDGFTGGAGAGDVVGAAPAFAGPIEVDGVGVPAVLLGLVAALVAARGLHVLSDRALAAGAASRCPAGEEE